ncbi:DUF6600 domain-containing protein [Spirosoma arcticum]
METAKKLWIVLVSMTLGLTGATATLAQPGYGQPGYGQPDYNQPNYDQRYDQPGYNQPGYDQPDGQSFYNELGPYGQWVQTPEYGSVWIPNVEPGFQPYATNGHWVVTEYGNTWVSDYAWGWAPFHYGRWYQDRYRGWAWVPGNDWGPAWVSWRSGGGYYGWAPLGPGININVSVNIPYNYWTFVPQIYITSPRLYTYCVPRPRVVNIYQNTTIINNVYRSNNRSYAYGPRREEIEYVTRRSVPVYRIENAGRPGRTTVRNNSVGIYRPDMNRSSRGDGNRYSNNQRDYSRPEYTPSRGTYNGNQRNNPETYNGTPRNNQPVETPRYQSRGPSSPLNQGRGSRYEPQTQPGQPAPQPERSQIYPQSSRQESFPQSQGSRGNRRQEPTVQRESSQSQPANSQTQRPGDYQPRSREQVQAPQGSTPERRGGSRGPR